MAPRKETVQERTSLVAILLADAFHTSFQPVSYECPPVLLPVVNVPLIEYSLEWLAANEVDEVLVFCCSQGAEVAAYLDQSKWSPDSEFMKVRRVTGQDCSSVGDALRFVDQLHLIKSDCLVLNGDTVANLHLKSAMEAHLNRRKQDSSAIMTVLMTPGHDLKQRLRLGEPFSQAIVDGVSKRLLKYKESRNLAKMSPLECETSLFSERDSLQVRTDLLDSQIYICAPEVLMLFSENFDYQNLSRDFIGGVLSEEELGNKIYFYECQREYAQRIHTWRRYDAISRDILGRWSYPFSPDTRIFARAAQNVAYQYQRGHQYLATDLSLPLTVQLDGAVCIGPKSVIGDSCLIKEAVIGMDCSVGGGSIISGSYLHNGVKIGKNVKISGSLLCAGCVVHDNAVIESGNVLSLGVVIGRNHILSAFHHISLCIPPTTKSSDDNEDKESPLSPQSVTGPVAEALKAAQALSTAPIGSGVIRPDYFNDELVSKQGAGANWPLADPSVTKLLSIAEPLPEYLEELEVDETDSESGTSATGLDPDQSFQMEVAETFLRCVYQRFSEENVVLELNGLKLAEVRTFVECASYIFTTLLQMCMPPPAHIRPIYHSLFGTSHYDLTKVAEQKQFLTTLSALLKDWMSVLRRFLKDEDDQVELMFAFEEFFKGEGVFNLPNHWGASMGPVVSNICQLLYNEDIVTEDAFLAWATEKENATDAEDLLFYSKAKKFIEWLREAEETESDSE